MLPFRCSGKFQCSRANSILVIERLSVFKAILPFFTFKLSYFITFTLPRFVFSAIRTSQGGVKTSLSKFFLLSFSKFKFRVTLNTGKDSRFHGYIVSEFSCVIGSITLSKKRHLEYHQNGLSRQNGLLRLSTSHPTVQTPCR